MIKPQDIYTEVIDKVDGVIKQLTISSEEEDLRKANDDTLNRLIPFQERLNEELENQKRNAEWDIFTIAFYGETNAGKSTLIEVLRIFLGEESKLRSQREFREIQEKYHLTDEALAELDQACRNYEQSLAEFEGKTQELMQIYAQKEADIHLRIDVLNRQIAQHYQQSNLWQKLLNFFIKTPEEQEVERHKEYLHGLLGEKANLPEKRKQQKEELMVKKRETARLLEEKNLQVQQLAPCSDGAIIGDGRSDYTQQTTRYYFTLNNQKFALLDVPGIEGKEGKVQKAILDAVQKAHAVFYITGKATVPQTGDENNQGMIEKIKAHLNAQTEVWTLFNKRINNASYFGSGELVNADERESLKELNEKMREKLGEHYRDFFPISALPAFLGIAEHLLPDSGDAKKRKKFLDKFTPEQIWNKTGLKAFLKLLQVNVLEDGKKKILHSNFNKVHVTLQTLADTISGIQKEYAVLANKFEDRCHNACLQLDGELESLQSCLKNAGNKAIDECNKEIRNEVYKFIKGDVSNDEFRDKLKDCIEEKYKEMWHTIPELVENEAKLFKDKIAEISERYQQQTEEMVAICSRQINYRFTDFNLNIDIKSKIGIGDFIAIAGGVAAVVTTWGLAWPLLAMSIGSLVISFAKAIWGFFDSDYKKAQQREATNKNLKKIELDVKSSFHKEVENRLPELEQTLDEIKQAYKVPVGQANKTARMLDRFVSELDLLSLKIKQMVR